jgi:hypothetical protein
VRRWLLFAGAALALLLVAGLLVLLLGSWESPTLTRAVLDALSGEGLELKAASVRLSPLRGVLLRDLSLTARLTDGELRATAEEALLTHRPLRLLQGEVLVEEIRLRRPQGEIVWDAAAAPSPAAAAAAVPLAPGLAAAAATDAASEPPPGAGSGEDGWSLDLRVERIGVEEGGLVMREEGVPGEMVRVEGLDLELRDVAVPAGLGSALLRAGAAGELAAQRLTTPALSASDATAGLRLRAGHLLVETLVLPTELGPITVEAVDLDLTRDPYLYTLRGVAQPLDTNALLGAKSGFGTATLGFALEGDGSEAGGPRGGGRLEVAGGTLGELPVLAAVERLLAGTDLVGSPYEPFVVDYTLNGELIALRPFVVEAGSLRFAGSGLVDLAGPLDLRLELTLPRSDVDVAEIPDEVLEALTDVDGRVKLPIAVRGTVEAPTVAFDRRSWAGLARRRLVDEAGRRLGEGLDRLLDRHR